MPTIPESSSGPAPGSSSWVFQLSGHSLALSQRTTFPGRAKTPRTLAGKTGIYFRSVGEDGSVLDESIVPDPHEKRCCLTHHSPDGTLVAGAHFREPESPVLLKLPDHPDARSLEVFRVSAPVVAGSDPALSAEPLGTFTL